MLNVKKLLTKILTTYKPVSSSRLYGDRCIVRKVSGICFLAFDNSSFPSVATDVVMFTLPVGFRPSATQNYPVFSTAGTFLGVLRMQPSGDVYPVFGALTSGTCRQTLVYPASV